MNFNDIAKKRFSARTYLDKEIPQDILNEILEAAHVAPTAANLQPVRIFVIKSEEAKAKLSKGANIYKAPLALLVCADKSKAWTRPFDGHQSGDIDASILTDHMMLSATEKGLGSVWICYFKPDVISEEFNLPENMVPINILALGYTDEKSAADRHCQTRISMEELVSYL